MIKTATLAAIYESQGLKEDAKNPETDLEKVADEVLKEDEE